MSSETWPPQLKDWVAKCLGQMTDANRNEAQAELRKVISDAFSSSSLWTTDWEGVQLQSLLPKQSTAYTSLKRKLHETSPINTKKAKKSALKNAGSLQDFSDQAALNRRAERFQREHEIERQKTYVGQASLKANNRTSHLFNGNQSRSISPSPFGNVDEPEGDPNVPNWDRYTIVGTCQELFKDYLRLTSEPKPEQIRPYSVLQRTLLELKNRWRQKSNYNWICSQFKSLRQDLTVQRIKNEFTVNVYEIHARMALEVSDMVEYNQCQSMLKTLYELGIPGKVEEFTAYRILMLLHGRNRSELNLYVGQLTPKQRTETAIQHALNVSRALSMGNYHAFFELYLNAPNMGAYIMDHFVARERVKALIVISKCYMKIPLSFIQNELAFDTLEQAREFLQEHNAGFFANPNSPDSQKILDCKPAAAPLAQVFEEKYTGKIRIKGAI